MDDQEVSVWKRYGNMSRRRSGERYGNVAPGLTRSLGPASDEIAVPNGWLGWIESSGVTTTVGTGYETEDDAKSAVDVALRGDSLIRADCQAEAVALRLTPEELRVIWNAVAQYIDNSEECEDDPEVAVELAAARPLLARLDKIMEAP